jgi:hypothetical protein
MTRLFEPCEALNGPALPPYKLVICPGQGRYELIGPGHMSRGADACYCVGTLDECIAEARQVNVRAKSDWPVEIISAP